MPPTILDSAKKAITFSFYILMIYIFVLAIIDLSNQRELISYDFPENLRFFDIFLAKFFLAT